MVEAACSSSKALQYSLGVGKMLFLQFIHLTSPPMLQVLWCVTAFDAPLDEAIHSAGGVALAVTALKSRCERTLLCNPHVSSILFIFWGDAKMV